MESYSIFDIEYFHIGGGIELESLKKFSNELNFKKFTVNFLGKITDFEKKEFFKLNPVDVFLNVSSSEGTSLSLVEALSYSIPVIVTSVGGNRSIGEYCNTSIDKEFSSKDLYIFFEKIITRLDYRKKLKGKSFNYWKKYHDQNIIDSQIINLFG